MTEKGARIQGTANVGVPVAQARSKEFAIVAGKDVPAKSAVVAGDERESYENRIGG
jgi:hypothetical protein